MNVAPFVRSSLPVLLIVCAMLLPVVAPDGAVWILMIAAALTVYTGGRASTVYGMAAAVSVSELLFSGHFGVAASAYVAVVLLYLLLRRVIAVPVWSHREGWRPADLFGGICAAWVFYAALVVAGVFIGDMLYGFDAVAYRLLLFATPDHALTAAAVCCATLIVRRRMDIPFHREILFGV